MQHHVTALHGVVNLEDELPALGFIGAHHRGFLSRVLANTFLAVLRLRVVGHVGPGAVSLAAPAPLSPPVYNLSHSASYLTRSGSGIRGSQVDRVVFHHGE